MSYICFVWQKSFSELGYSENFVRFFVTLTSVLKSQFNRWKNLNKTTLAQYENIENILMGVGISYGGVSKRRLEVLAQTVSSDLRRTRLQDWQDYRRINGHCTLLINVVKMAEIVVALVKWIKGVEIIYYVLCTTKTNVITGECIAVIS